MPFLRMGNQQKATHHAKRLEALEEPQDYEDIKRRLNLG